MDLHSECESLHLDTPSTPVLDRQKPRTGIPTLTEPVHLSADMSCRNGQYEAGIRSALLNRSYTDGSYFEDPEEAKHGGQEFIRRMSSGHNERAVEASFFSSTKCPCCSE
jgi:hypothetical protein